jgi:hypothetical protein
MRFAVCASEKLIRPDTGRANYVHNAGGVITKQGFSVVSVPPELVQPSECPRELFAALALRNSLADQASELVWQIDDGVLWRAEPSVFRRSRLSCFAPSRTRRLSGRSPTASTFPTSTGKGPSSICRELRHTLSAAPLGDRSADRAPTLALFIIDKHGVLHHPLFGRKSAACDLASPCFRITSCNRIIATQIADLKSPGPRYLLI